MRQQQKAAARDDKEREQHKITTRGFSKRQQEGTVAKGQLHETAARDNCKRLLQETKVCVGSKKWQPEALARDTNK